MNCVKFVILLFLFNLSTANQIKYTYDCGENQTIIAEFDAVINTLGNDGASYRNIDGINGTCSSTERKFFQIEFEKNFRLKIIIEDVNDTVTLKGMKIESDSGYSASAEFNMELSSLDEYFLCEKNQSFSLTQTSSGNVAIVHFQYFKLQAFEVTDDKFSPNKAECKAKVTTPSPTTHSSTTSTTHTPTHSTTPVSNHSTTPVSTHSTTPVSTHSTARSTTSPTTVSPTGDADLEIKDGKDNVCLFVKFTGVLMFQYKKDKVTLYETHEINHGDVIGKPTGNCATDRSFVKAKLTEGCSVEFKFAKVHKLSSTRRLLTDQYDLNEVIITYDTSKPKGAVDGRNVTMNNTQPIFTTSVGTSYRCNSNTTLIKDDTMSFTVKDFHAGAYSPKKENVETCDADKNEKGSNVVPIVVGVILACLVVIIIVAYLIGRRRNREGYQSV